MGTNHPGHLLNTSSSTLTMTKANGNGSSKDMSRRRSAGSSVGPSASPGLSSSSPGLNPSSSGLNSPSYGSSLRTLASILNRLNFAEMAGFHQFGDSRKLFEVLGYPSSITLEQYDQRFRRGGIARRIVKAFPTLMGWAKVSLIEDEDPEVTTAFETAWEDLFQRLSIGSVFKRADIMAGKGEYSCIYIGVKEKKGVDLSSEMRRLSGPDDVVYLRPFDQMSCQIHSSVGDKPDDDFADERYGLPLLYDVQFSPSRMTSNRIPGTRATGGQSKRVHWSRIIHVTHEPLDNEVFSAPVLEAVWNYLIDLDKLAGGGSESVYRTAVKRTLLDLDLEIGPDQISPDDLAILKEDLELMMHNLKDYAFTRGVTPKPMGGDSVKFGENVKTIISLISATLDVPQRVLLGSESAYASASEDKNTQEETILARREEFGTPVLRQLADRLIKYNGLPKPKEYQAVWPSEESKKLKQKTEIIRNIALANQAQAQADGTIIMTNDEARDLVFGMEPIEVDEDEEVEQNEEEVEQNKKVEVEEESEQDKETEQEVTQEDNNKEVPVS